MRLLQVFRGGEDFRSTYLRAESRKHASQIVSMAERLWGDTDPMTAELRIRCAMFEHTDLKSSLPPADLTRIYDVFSDCFATINAAWRSGMVPNSVWIEFVNEFSAELRQATEFFAQSDRVKAESLSKTRAEYWHSATHETGLREAWEVAFSSPDPLPLTSMHQLLHNYLAIPFRSHDLRVVMDAVKFAYEKFIPLRKRVSESVNREITYRLALQITTLPINNLLVREDISPEDEAWLVELAEDLAIQLWDSTLRKRLFDSNSGARHDPEESDLAFLASLMRAQLSVLEHQHLASKALDETLQQTATTVRVAWETYAHLLKQNTTSSGDLVSARTDARRFTEFGEFAGRAKGLARAYDQELTQETRDTLTTSFSSVEAIQRSLGADPKSRES
jgi:hypothetical protein